MSHKPIRLENIALSFPHKICFEDFSVHIPYSSRIAIIGRNGCGKSTLLKILQATFSATSGNIIIPKDVIFGYVPQIIEDFDNLSGGQRLNTALTQALSLDPNVLLLDEPTNHLDKNNRKSLMRMLRTFPGTLIVVSHDVELLRNCTDTLWHIDNGKIHTFFGNYDDYMHEVNISRTSIELELSRLDRQKKDMHERLMQEQKRAAKSKASGERKVENRQWLKMVGDLKGMKAEKSQGKKLKNIDHKKQELNEKLSELRLPEIIVPKFSLSSTDIGERTIVSISEGNVGYQDHDLLLSDMSLSVGSRDRIAIIGDNGSGKSTLIKAILDDLTVIKSGRWHAPKLQDIGYLDQHYVTLCPHQSVIETIQELVPHWTHGEIRRHLNDFLFRKNEEVNAQVKTLSGGEKVRLTLAQITAKTPKLLILDEITNNLDLETIQHIIQVLKAYPGALIVISHDEEFLKRIGVEGGYKIENGTISYQ